MDKLVSFIIPHKGREEMLVATVESIFALDFDINKIEVLIVTQNPTLNCIDSFNVPESCLNVLFPAQGQTISALRNIGAKQAKGEYFAFLDADVALSKNWLTTMLHLLAEDEKRKLVSAMQIDGPNAPVLEQIRTVLSNAELDTNVNFLPGRNLFLHRQTFEQVGGFPEHLMTCEDYYFTDKVHELGDLYYSSQAQYVHIGEDKELKPMYHKEVWRGQSNLQSIKGRNIPLREIPSFVIPPAMMFAVLVSLGAFISGLPSLALMALLIFLLPIVIYSMRLHRLAERKISLWQIIKFYSVYFPARAKGTLLGIVRVINVKESR